MDKKALIAQISQNVALPPKEPDHEESEPPKPEVEEETRTRKASSSRKGRTTKPRSVNSGRPAAFWVGDGDREIFHELGMLLYTQGIKPSDSLILRAAIRLMPRDHRFIEEVRTLQALDGRKVRHKRADIIA